MPREPGFHEITVPTYKPSDDLYTKIHSFFLGGAIKVKEFASIQNTIFKNNMV